MYKIRDIAWTDLLDVIETYYSFYDEVNDNRDLGLILYSSKPSFEDEVKWFSDRIIDVRAGRVVMKVAEVDGRVVGWCDIVPLRINSEVQHVGVLGILVRRGYRGKGLGSSLLRSALEEGRSKFSKVRLEVFSVNEVAIRLYERAGFNRIGVFPREVRRGSAFFDVIVMEYYY
ncbi:hypothetical protein GCM10007981_02000 [Thermocladium modestius]|uniref:N-acetyltransferase domain-containing protein n=1 Tax=Thermocladium modestius TaxID=62609 RepID=A0A830GRZ5_9CREN|nr:GNAT family N-acetyltransferase [Thermocladium modestius]GGP19215.1 hypothetical protein GCM10007981_02000 [Thermocladium modestius]